MILEKQSKEKKSKDNKRDNVKNKNIFLRVVIILIIIILIAAGVFIYKWQKNGGGIEGILKTTLGHDENTVNNLDKMYCLILGQSQNLTDTIMLASYDPKTQEASLLSIPRDTFVGDSKAYAGGMDKINAVYQTGVNNLMEDVRDITGIDVQYYLKVDTEALKVLVDEIGGVYFDVPIDMHYTDRNQGLYIDLKSGYQLLDGDKAEQVVRFRHNSDGSTYPAEYGGEDLGRMKTQRAFLTALLNQIIENMNVNMVLDFMKIAEQYVETNLNFDVVKDYIPYVFEFNIDNLKTATLPGIAEQASATGIWIYSVYEDEAEEVVNELFHGISKDKVNGNVIDENTINNTDISNTDNLEIEVLNGSGSLSKLSEVVADLEKAGYDVIQTGNTSTTSNTTVIDRQDILESDLQKLKEILGTQNITTGDSSDIADATIIIGLDYNM